MSTESTPDFINRNIKIDKIARRFHKIYFYELSKHSEHIINVNFDEMPEHVRALHISLDTLISEGLISY